MEAVFKSLSIGGKLSGANGVLKITPQVILWKTETRNETINPKELARAYWMPLDSLSYQLKLEYTSKHAVKFDGFKKNDYAQLQSLLLDNFGLELEAIHVSTKGDNHGECVIQGITQTAQNYLYPKMLDQFAKVAITSLEKYANNGSNLYFSIDNKYSFEIPFTEVAGSKMTANAKNDVVVEFNQESTLGDEDEQLMEIRFFIPNIKEGSKEDGTDDKHNPTTAQIFNDVIKEKTAINTISGANFFRLPSVHLLTPRGRYDIEMFPNFVKFHGKTHDYLIRYEQITRLFQLPKSDKDVFFIVSLEPAIRQGGTRYQHLVMQFEMKQKTTMTISLPPELEDKFKNLPREFNEEMYSVVNKVFNGLTNHKVTMPSTFKSKGGAYAIKCSMKANDGYLYPLAKSFFWIPKLALYIRFSEIASVEFARAGNTSSNRTFDFVVTMRDGEAHAFMGVQKSEYEGLFDFIRMKNIRIVNQDEDGEGTVKMPFGDDDDEESEDEYLQSSEGEEEVDGDFKSDDDGENQEGEEEEEKTEKAKEEKGKEKVKGKETNGKRKDEGAEAPSKKHKSDQ